jgi:hypothetical protein
VVADYSLVVRRYAPFESFGGGFEGDNRQFSVSMTATARTVGIVLFSRLGAHENTAKGYSSGSSYLGPWAVRRSHKLGAIGKHIGQVRVQLTAISSNGGKVAFTIQTSGNLPIKDVMLLKPIATTIDKLYGFARPNLPHPQGSPNIDTFLDFKATIAGAVMDIEGVMRGDSFPNAEVFLLDTKQRAAPLLDYRTSGGIAGPLRLIIAHPHTKRAEFCKRISLQPDGSFHPNAAAGPPTVVQEK